MLILLEKAIFRAHMRLPFDFELVQEDSASIIFEALRIRWRIVLHLVPVNAELIRYELAC